MLGKYKAVVCDLDGSLLRKDQTISMEMINYLHELQRNDIKVIIATGRAYKSVFEIVQNVYLKDFRSYLVTSNGQSILNFNNNEFTEGELLTMDETLKLIKLAREHSLIIYMDNEEFVYTDRSSFGIMNSLIFVFGKLKNIGWIFKQVKRNHIVQTKNIEDYVNKPIRKLCFAGLQKQLDEFKDAISEIYPDTYEQVFVSSNWFEILRKGNSKGHAITKISKELNIPLTDFIAFGDGENDISMLKAAGCGVAMGNALETVKIVADDITKTNDEDGIYHYLKSINN